MSQQKQRVRDAFTLQAEAYANIAAANHTMGKLDQTIAALREEVRLDPNLPSARSNLDIELAVKQSKLRQ